MSYKVLYRKYRPSTFNDIIGQKFITDTLKESIISNKISHAYIFSGPKGTGKTSTARVFAKAINCENPTDGEPCGKCNSCINFESNPDIIELDAASNNKVEDIREIVNSVKLAPSNSKYKIYIIDEVHMLTNSASNAFLLTLEEPPSHAIFILATTNPESLLKTILSRCQQFAFSKISRKALIERIKYVLDNEKISMDDNIINEIATLSDGGLRDALSILDQLVTLNKPITMDILTEQFGIVSEKSVSDLIDDIINNDIESIKKIFEQLREYGISEKSFIEKFVNLLTLKICDLKETNNADKIQILKNIVFEIVKIDNYKTNFSFYDIIEIIVVTNLPGNNSKIISQEIKNDINNSKKEENSAEKHETNEVTVVTFENDEKEEENINEESCLPKVNTDLINIRINNSFYNASLELKKEIKNNFDNLSELLKKNNELYSLFIDLEVGVVSPTNILLVSDTEASANLLNENASIIKEKTELDKEFVFVGKEKWNLLKNDYVKNKNTKKYSYIEEPKNVEGKSEIENLASDIFGNNIIMEEE